MKALGAAALAVGTVAGLALVMAGALLDDRVYLTLGGCWFLGIAIGAVVHAAGRPRTPAPVVPLEPMRHRATSGVDAYGPFIRCECGDHFETVDQHTAHLLTLES